MPPENVSFSGSHESPPASQSGGVEVIGLTGISRTRGLWLDNHPLVAA